MIYGMTVAPTISVPMGAVLKNIEVRGSTMGSRAEFKDMIAFVDEKKIRPIVSRVVEGSLADIGKWDELFDDMRRGKQFGKLVYAVKEDGGRKGSTL